MEGANLAVLDVVARGTGDPIANGEERFHWIAPLLIRVHELFAPGRRFQPGRLSKSAAAGIRRVLWLGLAADRALFEALNAFVKERLRERVKKGLLVECASPGYGKYTLQCGYNYHAASAAGAHDESGR